MALRKMLWVPSLAADSCATKKDPFESAVAEGIHIDVPVFGGQLVWISKGHRGWQKPGCDLWLLQVLSWGKGFPS